MTGVVDVAVAQPASASHNETLQATDPQSGALFGYSGTTGRFAPAAGDLTPFDDFVVTALNEGEPNSVHPSQPFTDLGAVYPRESDGSSLDAHPNHPRVLPAQPWNSNTQLGCLDAVVGDVRNGPGQSTHNPLLFMSAPRRDVYDNSCVAIGGSPITISAHGSVEMLDVNSLPGTAPTTFLPPKEPGNPCNTQRVRWFGHAIAVGDVIDFNGGSSPDGIDDLIVGAPVTVQDASQPREWIGRVYIFAGHANFMAQPALKFVVLEPPVHPASVSGSDGSDAYNEYRFGFDVAVDDLDGDGFDEVVVGRPGVGGPAAAAGGGPGRAYVFWGSWINSQVSQILFGQKGIVVDPPGAPAAGVYEMLVDSTNSLISSCGAIEADHLFGWLVWTEGDLGAPSPYGADSLSRPDVLVHAEGSDFLCSGQVGHVNRSGALFTFFNDHHPTSNPTSLIDELAPVKLQEMSTNPGERLGDGSRFGRGAVALDWVDCTSGTPVERRSLVIGEPGLGVGAAETAISARTWMLWTPIVPTSMNDWSSALLDPTLPNPITDLSSSFGAWVAKGRFRDPLFGPIGDQLIVTAREKTYSIGAATHSIAGHCYVFHPSCGQ